MTLSEKGSMLCDILPRVHLEFNSDIKEPLHRFYSVQNMGFITQEYDGEAAASMVLFV